MFSSMEMEEYMESELPGNFRVKLVDKNLVLGSPGNPFYACEGQCVTHA